MENFTEKIKELWTKLKTFMLKKWEGVPYYILFVAAPLLLIIGIYYFSKNSTTKIKRKKV